MAGLDKRDADYTEAREELMREISDRGLSYLDEPQRGDAIREIVRRLGDRHPDLDDQLTRRLMGEGMRRAPEATDSPPGGEPPG